MERVSDERLDELVAVVDARMFVVTLVADETRAIMHELRDRRAAEREQAAPKPRKLAKWERRLRKIDGSLRYNAKDDQWEVWWEPQRGDVMDTVDFGKTPQAAVEAAWKAWKEARGE